MDVGEHLDSTTDQADQVTFRWEGFWGGAPWCPQMAKVWAVPTSFWQVSWVAQRGERELGSHGWKHFHRTLKLVLKLSQAQSSQPFCKGPTGPTGMGGM